jgi:hypothetical protein
MRWGDLLRNVTDALDNDGRQRRENRNQDGGLLDTVLDALDGQPQSRDPRVRPASEDPLGDPADQGYGRSVLPASQDPLGDPADQEQYGRSVLPASQDPLGDPADQFAGRNIRPASEDPLGDPADEPPRRVSRRRR